MKNRFSETGRSMVEMMGYMVVVMTLITMVGRIVTNAFEEHKYSKASAQLSDLANAIVKAAAVEPDYDEVIKMVNGTATDNVKNAEGLKIIPTSFRLVGRKMYHAFGGEAEVSLPPSAIGGTDKFAISFKGLRKRQCVELAMKDWRKNPNVDLYSVIINMQSYWYWPIYKQNVENVLPVTRAKLTGTGSGGQCSLEKGNTVVWVFN